MVDEPIAGLDPLGRAAFLRLVTRLNRAGTTILMISHNADALGECAKRLLVLEDGALALDGGTKEVFGDIARLRRMHLCPSAPRRLAALLTARGMPLAQPQRVTAYDELLAAVLAAKAAPAAKGGDAL